MARAPRIQEPNGIYHVMTRGVRKWPIFTERRDRLRFLQLLAEVVGKREWRCHAHCLMTNHYHLLVQTPHADISAGMQWLNGVYAQWFNWRYGYEGHVFERRFRSLLVEGDAHLIELTRYIVLNPVRAGACGHVREWRWSSYRATAGIAERPTFLTTELVLGLFSRDRDRARGLYADFVARGTVLGAMSSGLTPGTRPILR